MNLFVARPWILFLGSSLIVLGIFLWMTRHSTADILQDAADLYAKGESASTVFERETAFNNALQLYLDLESQFSPHYSNGKLYYNIANTFFQLNEYPFAILYYTRALALNNDERIRENLETAREKARVAPPQKVWSLLTTLSLKEWLSLPSRFQLFSFSLLSSFFLFSFYIWTRYNLLRQISYLLSLLTAYFLLAITLDLFFAPQEAVLIHSENLRIGASNEFASVMEEPIASGSLVEVVEEEKGGSWLKVLYNGDKMGFIPTDSLRKV